VSNSGPSHASIASAFAPVPHLSSAVLILSIHPFSIECSPHHTRFAPGYDPSMLEVIFGVLEALLLRERAGESSAQGVPLDDIIDELGFTHAELQHGR